MSLSHTKLIVFARAPVPGRCKTRLIAKYGARGAARIHRTLVTRTLATAKAARMEVELWCEPGTAHGFFKNCRQRFEVRLATQPFGDLGRKMAWVLARSLAPGAGKTLIVGTDCPALTVQDLQTAAAQLDRCDVVLQPAEDGGYVLIGANTFPAGALRAIDWSSGAELRQTRRALARHGLRWTELPQRWDVDWPADVRRARRAGLLV